MPVPLFKHHFCRRAHQGPKAHAHAAYLSGTKLDDGLGRTADFTPKGGILLAELWVPEDAPDWAKDRGQLWKRLEARENKTTRPGDAILAHKFIAALPCELTLEENIRLVKDYVREQFTRKGYAADWAIHGSDPGSDQRNTHVHIMVPLRRLENGSWAKHKDRFPRNSPALSRFTKEKQRTFFELQNRYLAKNGFDCQIVRKDGVWTVVGYIGSTFAQSQAQNSRTWEQPYGESASTSNAQGKNPGNGHGRSTNKTGPTMPSARPISFASVPGGSNVMSSARRSMAAAAQAALKPTAGANLRSPTSKAGWPIEAVTDWEAWGEKNKPRFFQRWPELGAPSSSPSTGGVV